jgi:C_GCAxxG_C_C family probable redox protein
MEDKRLDEVFADAKEKELSCAGCAQCTVAAVLDALDIENESAFKAASGMAMGMGLSGDGTCGAILGGAMAIGLLFGRDCASFEDPSAAMRSYDMVRLLYDDVKSRYGTTRCNDLQIKFVGRSFDMDKDEDYEAAVEAGLSNYCSDLVGSAARKALEIILKAQAEDRSKT